MDRYLAALSILVLLLCSALLLEDLRWIEIPGLTQSHSKNEQIVGRIASLHNQVKRRGVEDILWARTKSEDQLYMRDAIFTASESRATLVLFENSKIELSENTLVVLEPPAEDSSQIIRLKFNTGAIASRMANKTEVKAGDYELKIEAGSEFHLRSEGNGYELELKKGTAQVISEEKIVQVNEKESLIMSEGKTESLKVSDEINWKNSDYLRLYALEKDITAQLSWNGEAEELLIKDKINLNLSQKVTGESTNLKVSRGTYFLRLKKNEAYSSLLTLEVLKSPLIHLYAPLPRDRVKIKNEVEFVWKKQTEAKKYKFEISSDAQFIDLIKSIETEYNSVKIIPEFKGRFFWRVSGIDESGFTIPAPYSNEIVFVENPIMAPDSEIPIKMRTPANQKPNDGATLFIKNPWILMWQMFVSNVKADEENTLKSQNIRFNWKKLNEADLYQLEIDDDPYFQSPEVAVTVNKNFYEWNTNKTGIVFWRVAGDSRTGRMGLFSSVQKTDLSFLRRDYKANSDFDVFIYKEIQAVTLTDKDISMNETTASSPEKQKSQDSSIKKEELTDVNLNLKKNPSSDHNWIVAYGFGFGSYQIQSKNINLTKLQGIEPTQVLIEKIIKNENSYIKIKTWHTFNSWKVKSTSKYPFQNQQNSWVGTLSASFASAERDLWLGGTVKKDLTTERKDLERIELKPNYLFGPSVKWDTNLEKNFFNSIDIAALFGNNIYGLSFSNYTRFRTKLTPYFNSNIGLKLDYQSLSVKGAGSNLYLGAGLFIGSEW